MKINRLILASWVSLFCVGPAHGQDAWPSADDYRPTKYIAVQEREKWNDEESSKLRKREIWQPPAPVRRRRPSLWVLRIKGENRQYLVPPAVMRELDLYAGQTVDDDKARDVAIEMGAKYPPDILKKLKEPEAPR